MSRWVRCSYGKRAGFVDAKIGIFRLTSKFFETFLPIFRPKSEISQAFVKGYYYYFLDKAIHIPKNFVSLQCFRNRTSLLAYCHRGSKNAEAWAVEAAGREPIYRKGVLVKDKRVNASS